MFQNIYECSIREYLVSKNVYLFPLYAGIVLIQWNLSIADTLGPRKFILNYRGFLNSKVI